MKVRVYRNWLDTLVGLIGYPVFGALAGYLVSMSLIGAEHLLLMVTCGGLSTLVLFIGLYASQPVLVLTEESVMYHAYGYRLEAKWFDVESVGPVKSWSPYPEGLRLRACQFGVDWFPGPIYVALLQIFFPDIRSTIPLGQLPFFRNWRRTNWGQEILARLPPTVLQQSLKGPIG